MFSQENQENLLVNNDVDELDNVTLARINGGLEVSARINEKSDLNLPADNGLGSLLNTVTNLVGGLPVVGDLSRGIPVVGDLLGGQ
jgi:hypothetical protein